MKKCQKGITIITLIIVVVVLIILASVTIGTISDGGIIGHTGRAANSMNMLQIEERAKLAKLEYTSEMKANIGLKSSIQEFRQRLLETFKVTKDTNNDNIIEVNDKYAVIIKNTDLDIEVVELTDTLRASSLVSLTYEISNKEVNKDIDYTNATITLTRLMDYTKYVEFKKEEDSKASYEEKEEIALQYLYESLYGEEFSSLEEAVLYELVYMWGYGDYTTLEECLEDEYIQSEWGTTKEQIYYTYYTYYGMAYPEGNELTEEELIELFYSDYVHSTNFYNTTMNISLYVKKDGGKEELIKDKIYLNDRAPTQSIDYTISSNGKYEFILRTKAGIEIVREALNFNDIVKNLHILTEEEAEGIWTINSSGVITAYNGRQQRVNVPLKIGNKQVTAIGSTVFKENTNIRIVTIPEGITKIENSAFYNCSNLTEVTIPSTVTSIGTTAFAECPKLKNITIPEGITSMGVQVFRACASLESIVIPKCVTSIGNYEFKDCNSLKSVTIPDSVISIGDGAFYRCSSITDITIPEGVTAIGSQAFYGCSSLNNITIPSSVTSIGNYAFYGCSSLNNITIPDSVNTMGTAVFYECDNLQNVTLPKGITRMENHTFFGCEKLANITIPNSVTSIGNNVFTYCESLKILEIPSKVTSIGSQAFYGCSGLTTITIPASVNSIGENAFYRCSSLTNIHFEGTVLTENRPWGASNSIITPK